MRHLSVGLPCATSPGRQPARPSSGRPDLAALLARISTDDQFQFGIRTFLAGLKAQQPELSHAA
jgi:hypothetical protein